MSQTAIQSKVVSGVGWSSFSSIINYVLLFTRTFILVRFLAPEDFGVMALSLLLVTVMKQFSHIGLESAIIQEDEVNKRTINTVWTVSIVRGFLFFGLINIFSPFYASFFDEPELITILTILSFAAIFNGFKNSYVVSTEKELRFDVLFKLTVITNLVEFITTIVLAIMYVDAMALAVGYVVGSITGLILSFALIERKPRFVFNRYEFFKLFKFGKWVFGSGILIFLILNIDTTVIGKVLGVAMLGYYQIAFRLGNFAATDIVLTFSKSIYPSFSLVKDDLAILKGYFFTTILIISAVILPIMVIVGFYAESFVTNFIGQNWTQIILPLKILIIFGLIRSFASVCGYVFWAVGKPKIPANISLAQLLLISIIILPLTNEYGIAGTALAVTIPLAITSIISFYFVSVELKANLKDFLEYLLSPFLSVVFLLVTIFVMKLQFEYIDSTLWFVVNAIFLMLIYSLYLFVFDYFGNKKISNIVKTIIDHRAMHKSS